MTDKEVGELWHEHTTQASKSHPYQTAMDKVVTMLIVKLVEERAVAYGGPRNDLRSQNLDRPSYKKTLRDFGIPEKEFEEWLRSNR